MRFYASQGRTAAYLVHGERLSGPVGGDTELSQLGGDLATVLLLPLPDLLHELLTTEVVSGLALFLHEVLLHDDLRIGRGRATYLSSNTGVVDAGDPEGLVAAHSLPRRSSGRGGTYQRVMVSSMALVRAWPR